MERVQINQQQTAENNSESVNTIQKQRFRGAKYTQNQRGQNTNNCGGNNFNNNRINNNVLQLRSKLVSIHKQN